jgi:SAM-dependent methyltransferase
MRDALIRAGQGEGVLAPLAGRLDQFNRRHPWSHNAYFHAWILRRLPARRQRALDAGCGRGQLAALLAGQFGRVDGIDRDAEMARAAADRFADDDRVTIRQLPFGEVSGDYDVITMVASLHHMDLEPALLHAASLLEGGGRLLVVGLARVATLSDAAFELASAVLNPVAGLVRHPRAAREPWAGPDVPVVDPAQTFSEIRAGAFRVLPGARLRRRLFFRYTLEWTKPGRQAAAGER